jgi:hypothetical protein
MTDQIAELASLNKLEYKVAEPDRFRQVAASYGRKLEQTGFTNLDDLINGVVKLEQEYDMPELTDAEFEILCLTSYVLGTASKNIKSKIRKEEQSYDVLRKARVESIEVQQHAVRLALSNVEAKKGEYDYGVARYFHALSTIFERYFQEEDRILEDPGVYSEAGFLRGIRGMITAAVLFDSAGWKVALPEPEDDYKYDADLFVQSPDGRIFAVDVTARKPNISKGEVEAFYLQKSGKPYVLKEGEWVNVEGFLRLNVPPLSHSKAVGFYRSDVSRAMGIPSPSTVEQFSKMLASEVERSEAI